jgi:CBS domain-containing protein
VFETPAFEIASKNVSTVEPETDVGKAAKVMREKDIGAMPSSRLGDLSAFSPKETSPK